MSPEPPPDPLGHVDSLLEMITRAHEIIFTRHHRLVAQGGPREEAVELVRESARIALRQATAAAKDARDAARDQAIARLLDPHTPIDDATAIQAIRAAEMTLTELLRRQQQIAAELAALTDS